MCAPESLTGGRVSLLVDSGGIGGIERHIAVLAGQLRRRGVDARALLLADHGPNPWLQQLAAAQVPCESIRSGVRGLFTHVRNNAPGLLHTHGYKAGILGRAAARLLSIPVVSTYHAGESAPFPVSLYQSIDGWTGLLAKRISVSQPIAARLPYPSRLIPNFIETPAAPGCDILPDVVGFVGRLSPEKGPDLFCAAAERRPDGPSWRVFGDGPMRAELAHYAEVVEFQGLVADMNRVWPSLGLMVVSSRAEGLPMAALEALAAGIPVAAARVGALPDLIRHGENGWLFDVGDIAAIRSIVATWSQRRKSDSAMMRRAAWASVATRYGADAGVDATLAVYREAGFIIR